MTRLIDIDNRKTEKVVLEVLKALGLHYELVEYTGNSTDTEKPLNKAELAMNKRLKKSFEQILHQEGKIKLKTIEEVLAELS